MNTHRRNQGKAGRRAGAPGKVFGEQDGLDIRLRLRAKGMGEGQIPPSQHCTKSGGGATSGRVPDVAGLVVRQDVSPLTRKRVGPPASPTPAHTSQLPLLPSGPGGVCCLALRGNRQGCHSEPPNIEETSVSGRRAVYGAGQEKPKPCRPAKPLPKKCADG
jgi:hypothetical protein